MVIALLKSVKPRVQAKVFKASDEGFGALRPPRESGKDHGHLGMNQKTQLAGPPVEPSSIDAAKCVGHNLTIRQFAGFHVSSCQ
jgi:hypothetical protein